MGNLKKLSVLKREEKQSGWHPTPAFEITQIKEIKIFDSRSDKSLNAIPSPLARLHLFDAAFSLVHQDESQKTNYSGYAYKKIVSDCFDVFELIYNWNYHKQEGKPLSFVTWKKDEEIANLKNEFESALKQIEERPKNNDESENQINLQEIEGFKTYLVGKTLNLFLNQSDFSDYNEFHIVKYNKTVIAGTSPFTGFFTTPNDLSTLDLINPFTRKKYFEGQPRTFANRDEKIKKYIDDFFQKKNSKGGRVFSNQLAVIDYLKHNKNSINDNLVLNLEAINPAVEILNNTITIETSKDRNDYLENYLVKVNYRINESCFYTASNLDTKRAYDYLLPLSPAFFSDFINSQNGFNAKDISSLVTVTEKGASTVEVSIKNKNGKPISKTYQTNKTHPLDGEIVNLTDGFGLNLSLSLFPNIIVENKPEMNNYFKVMLGSKSKDKKFANKDIDLSFFTNDRKIESKGEHIKLSLIHI